MKTEEEITKIILKERNLLQNMLKSLRDIKNLQEKPQENLYKIKQELSKIEEALKQSRLDDFIKKEIEQKIKAVKSKIQAWEEDIKKNFGQKLEKKIRELGFELRGHYPLLKVAFYTLEIDLANSKTLVWYGPRQERLEVCELIPEKIVKKLKVIHDKIVKRKFSDDEFLSKLYEAYKIAICRRNKKFGVPIPIIEVLFEYVFLIQDKKFRINPIRDNYKEYGRVFFSYDLYRLKKRQIENKLLELITATRAYTRQKSDFLWIPSNLKGDGSYISHIRFREVKS